ncbi:DUF2066 domain-containing protein [Vibrio brasiliensis]|uniref:DUF2066 domain-containing protein n=1 Tax=Vibrio brasiliensis TaxID=170652 RepID=UPI001EFDF5AF|nr:DUF2066 domain-containing protein [Vibrio brasiliensis]MCG9646965.1 DUF2066 domain-containing protein [Vibrio brasiliensis]
MRQLALLVLGMIALPAMALTNVDLYRTEIVLDQTVDNADAQARAEGMKEVIVKASGDRNAVTNPVVQKALKQSAQYLAQLSYGQANGEQTLRMGFSAPHIRSLLSQAQLPVWPAARANLLVWLVEEGHADRNIVWEHSNSAVLTQMQAEAEKRGLPLTVPVGDFDDITGVAVSDLWGGFIQPVGQASQRYPVDAVLVVKAQGNSLRWTLYDQKPATIGITRQAPLSGSNNGADAADKMINQISDYYAKKSAVVVASESSQAIKVRFTELNDAVGFFTLENQLKKLSSVASLDILKIQGNQVTFNVHLLSSEQEFEQEVNRLGDLVQRESVTEQPQIVVPEVTTVESGSESVVEQNIETTTQGEQSTALEVQPQTSQVAAEVIATEMILVFEWQGKPYVAPEPQINPESESPNSDSVTETSESALITQ